MFFNGLSPKPENCCGCESCRSICPKSAINMSVDNDGFIIPVVNPDKCIECGLCEKVCPMFHSDSILPEKIGDSYAAVSKNGTELSESSSGGVFSLIADYILKKGGVVCGAAFDDKLDLGHILIYSNSEMTKLRGSKYIQSRIGSAFEEIRNILISGRFVYFVGTGCQVAGLRLFLRREYDNLLTSDILCHGVPPQSVFSEMIRMVEMKHNGKIVKYSFRDKSVWGWSCSSSSNLLKNGKLKYLGNEPLQQAYFNAFINGDNYRESCYVCPFAKSNRAGDVTLGDFWGVGNYIPVPDIRKGVSAILVNTDKGARVLSEIKDRISLYPANLEDIKKINKTLDSPTPRPAARNSFFNEFHTNPYKTLSSYYRPNVKRDIVYTLKRNKLSAKLIFILRNLLHR